MYWEGRWCQWRNHLDGTGEMGRTVLLSSVSSLVPRSQPPQHTSEDGSKSRMREQQSRAEEVEERKCRAHLSPKVWLVKR